MSIIIKLMDTIEKNQLVSCPKIQDVQSYSIVHKRLKLKSIMCNFVLKNVSPERAKNKTTSGLIGWEDLGCEAAMIAGKDRHLH